ncbi:MAG: bifunctional UDP-N-acetylglucosamine diphosphorylase/glucosamine-1-phosphate N-acetyltransferase GlmU [Bacillota bacterium]
MENLNAIILAAGEGSRMKSKKAKVLHELFHKPMIAYVIEAGKEAGAKNVCIVVGNRAEQVKEAIGDTSVSFALQAEQKGTGHAVMMAEDMIDENSEILILYGDTPLLQGDSLQEAIAEHKKASAAATVITMVVENPMGYGRIVRDPAGNFSKIVEQKDANADEQKITEVNTGIYIFKGKFLKEALHNLKNNNAQGEYYLTDTLEYIKNQNAKVLPLVSDTPESYFGVNSRQQLAVAMKIMQRRINESHMANGVTLIDPDTSYIDHSVKIGMDTVISGGCHLVGATEIGEDCTIGAYTRLVDMKIGDGVEIQATTALESSIDNQAIIGPYAYIRPNSAIGEKAKIGDFVEIKNATIGKGTKVPHLSYIGDTDAGEKVNFGCGSIMVNYDGKKKYRTTVGDNVFVGCNANLVAPVTVHEGAYVAAGSTITKDVTKEVLVVARARQVEIPNWKKK